jgi:hypothetical protein
MSKRQDTSREDDPLMENYGVINSNRIEDASTIEGICVEKFQHQAQDTALWWTVFFLGTGTLVGWNRLCFTL